jgi:hypothetical protein
LQDQLMHALRPSSIAMAFSRASMQNIKNGKTPTSAEFFRTSGSVANKILGVPRVRTGQETTLSPHSCINPGQFARHPPARDGARAVLRRRTTTSGNRQGKWSTDPKRWRSNRSAGTTARATDLKRQWCANSDPAKARYNEHRSSRNSTTGNNWCRLGAVKSDPACADHSLCAPPSGQAAKPIATRFPARRIASTIRDAA